MDCLSELRHFVRPWNLLDACYLLWAVQQDDYDMNRIARSLDRTPAACEHFHNVLCKDENWKEIAVPRASTKASPAHTLDYTPKHQPNPYSVPNRPQAEIVLGGAQ